MKTLLFCLLATAAYAQRYDFRHSIAPASLSFVSGTAWGTHEALYHHWPAVHSRYPGLKESFWNPAVSWERPTVVGYKFDAKHLLASTNQITAFSAGACIAIGEKRPWWHYAVDAGISFAAYSAGNWLTYNVILK